MCATVQTVQRAPLAPRDPLRTSTTPLNATANRARTRTVPYRVVGLWVGPSDRQHAFARRRGSRGLTGVLMYSEGGVYRPLRQRLGWDRAAVLGFRSPEAGSDGSPAGDTPPLVIPRRAKLTSPCLNAKWTECLMASPETDSSKRGATDQFSKWPIATAGWKIPVAISLFIGSVLTAELRRDVG